MSAKKFIICKIVRSYDIVSFELLYAKSYIL